MAPDTIVVCVGCERGIETCAFCDADGCPEAICYRCLTSALGETIIGPHEHGG